MLTKNITRRRMISIMAGAVGGALVNVPVVFSKEKLLAYRWQGVALGAKTEIVLHHVNRAEAFAILHECRLEIERLENLFSLYKPDSAIAKLNRRGWIENPAFEFVEILSRSEALSIATQGAFDITVQPLWELYSNHFKRATATSGGPSKSQIEQVLKLVDYRLISVSAQKIEFGREGMGITLNGIAQGYITNRVAAVLKRRGYGQVLLNIGEVHGIGRKPSGAAWRASIADPETGNFLKAVPLDDQAMATSAGHGTRFSTGDKFHHLFDPNAGKSTNRYRSVSVVAKDATNADALSTAFSAMPMNMIKRVLQDFAGTRAIIIRNNGKMVEI